MSMFQHFRWWSVKIIQLPMLVSLKNPCDRRRNKTCGGFITWDQHVFVFWIRSWWTLKLKIISIISMKCFHLIVFASVFLREIVSQNNVDCDYELYCAHGAYFQSNGTFYGRVSSSVVVIIQLKQIYLMIFK